MAGLIILFWFVAESVALRYLVRRNHLVRLHRISCPSGFVHRRYVVHVCPVGRHWSVLWRFSNSELRLIIL
jgi:hypothetical protein